MSDFTLGVVAMIVGQVIYWTVLDLVRWRRWKREEREYRRRMGGQG